MINIACTVPPHHSPLSTKALPWLYGHIHDGIAFPFGMKQQKGKDTLVWELYHNADLELITMI